MRKLIFYYTLSFSSSFESDNNVSNAIHLEVDAHVGRYYGGRKKVPG
jgi:hypothetical protein